jgi:hypothetical protein
MPSVHPQIPLPLPLQGIRPDVDDFHIPPDALRSTSYNWLLRDGKIVTRPGLTTYGPATTGRPTGIFSYRDHNQNYKLVMATTTGWWSYSTVTDSWTDITGAGLPISTATQRTIFRAFNTGGVVYLLGVNRINAPYAWDSDPTHDYTLFGGSPPAPTAGAISICADRVLLGALNVAGGGTQIDVSAFQDHTSGWGTVQTTTLVDTPGYIICMQELGANQTAVYKTDAIYLASGTTGLAPIRFDLHSASVPGPANPRAVIPLSSGIHAVFTNDAELYLFDGASYLQHPASDAVRKLFETNGDITTNLGFRDVHGYYDTARNELRFFYIRPELINIGPRDVIVVNMSNNSVWKLNYDASALSFTASFFGEYSEDGIQRKAFLGRSTGQIYLPEGPNDAGGNIDAKLETGLSDMGDSTRLKSIEETEHYFANPVSSQLLSVQLLTSTAGKAPDVSAASTLTLNPASEGPYRTGHRDSAGERIAAQFAGLRIQGNDLSQPLEYRGSSVLVIPRGSR